jgi:DUF917 family protein
MSDRPNQEASRNVTVNTGSGSQVAAAGGNQDNISQQMISTAQHAEIEELLALLRSELDAHADELDNRQAFEAQATSVEKELRSSQPDFGTVKGLLSGMATAAVSVTSILDVVKRLQELIGGLG